MESTLAPFRILLVEDNPNDIEITRRALAKGQVKNELTVARDGQEALDILKATPSSGASPSSSSPLLHARRMSCAATTWG